MTPSFSKVKPEKATKKIEQEITEKGLMEGWALFNPLDVYETEDLTVFCHFLNSKGTHSLEIVNIKIDSFTLVIRGNEENNPKVDTSCVLFHKKLTDVSRPKKIELVETIYSLPGLTNIARNRLGNTLASYFGVSKEVKAN